MDARPLVVKDHDGVWRQEGRLHLSEFDPLPDCPRCDPDLEDDPTEGVFDASDDDYGDAFLRA